MTDIIFSFDTEDFTSNTAADAMKPISSVPKG